MFQVLSFVIFVEILLDGFSAFVSVRLELGKESFANCAVIGRNL